MGQERFLFVPWLQVKSVSCMHECYGIETFCKNLFIAELAEGSI
jgi:hypothetical protein